MSSPFPILTSAAGFVEALERNPAVAGELINQLGTKRARKLFALDKHYPEVFDPEAPDLRESVTDLAANYMELGTADVAESLVGIILQEIDHDEAVLTGVIKQLTESLRKMTGHHFERDEAGKLKSAINELYHAILIEE